MSDLRKAAEMALEALENYKQGNSEPAKALRQALAQPEQEPVAQLQEEQFGRGQVLWFNKPADKTMLYTAPPKREWVGLTDEEVDECYYWKDRLWTTDELVRHVEAKLKEKNT